MDRTGAGNGGAGNGGAGDQRPPEQQPPGHAYPGARGASFGTYLAELLDERGVTARVLAAKLNVDVSLVYKWLRGDRTPAGGSGYLDAIDAFLDLSGAERNALRAAQENSQGRGRPKKSVPKRIASLAARIVSHLPDSGMAETAAAGFKRTPRLPLEGAIIERQKMQQAVIDLVGGVPAANNAEDAILMTYQSDGSGTYNSEAGRQWKQAVWNALRHGWRIEHIWRLNRDLRRSVFLVTSMLDMLGAGDYQPLYTSSAENITPPYDLVIRPDAALLLLATENAHNVDAGILTRDPQQIRLLSAHFAQLRAQAKPLLQSFRRDDPRFGAVVVESETGFPGRSIVKYGLSLFTEPDEWSRPDSAWARRMAYPEKDVATFCERRQARIKAFRANISRHLYREICPKQAIVRLVTEGRYARYTEQGRADKPTQVASKAERAEHLRYAIQVLRTHDNFQLALVDEVEAETLPVRLDTYWEVVGADRALINVRTLDASGQPVDREIVIDEPTIVAGCAAHFDQLWESIQPRNRDKDYVVWWLERQLETLPA